MKKTEAAKKQEALKKLDQTRKDLIDLARTQAHRIYRMTKNPVSAGQVYTALGIKLNDLSYDDAFKGDQYFQDMLKLYTEADKRWLGGVFNDSWEVADYKPIGSHCRRVAVWIPKGVK